MTDLVHASILYWQAAGVILLLSLVSMMLGSEMEKDDRWESTRIVIEACVPEEKKRAVVKAINERQEKRALFSPDMRRLIGFSFLILVGLVIHVFFV